MGGLSDLRSKITRLVSRTADSSRPAPGVYHFLRQDGLAKSRVHLRVEQDGHGLLLVNAARAFHLNPTATHMAYLSLEGYPNQEAIDTIHHTYRVSTAQAQQDYAALVAQLEALVDPSGKACPICDLEIETTAPFSNKPSAPYRMDLALTYRCNNNCAHCYNARPRQYPEMSTEQWKEALDRLWAAGIPHIVFTGGEPTLRPDLPELIAHAEKNGQITGINTNGRKLKDPAFLQALIDAGLDHVQITLESHDAEIHDRMVAAKGAWEDTVAGVKNALNSRLYVMTNTTLLQHNACKLAGTLDFLAELGVPTIGLNALIYSGKGASVGTGLSEASLPPLLEMARAATDRHGQRLIWYTPTQYCHFDPVLLDLGVKGCSAALYNMCVEPDGSVIPCQSYYQPIGHLLEEPWDAIWNHDLAVALRERKGLPEACTSCALIKECGGGCPLSRQFDPATLPTAVHPIAG